MGLLKSTVLGTRWACPYLENLPSLQFGGIFSNYFVNDFFSCRCFVFLDFLGIPGLFICIYFIFFAIICLLFLFVPMSSILVLMLSAEVCIYAVVFLISKRSSLFSEHPFS